MKFSINGALTIGTLDGANVEIREEVGEENFFLFGLTAEQVMARKAAGYNPLEYIDKDPRLMAVMELFRTSYFCPEEPTLFNPLVDSLIFKDEYMLMADFADYVACQQKVSDLYSDQDAVDAQGHPERGPHGQVLLGPHHPGIQPGHLAGHPGAHRAGPRRGRGPPDSGTIESLEP